LFEKLVLEGFLAGLSWITILRKRENFRRAFDGFDPDPRVVQCCLRHGIDGLFQGTGVRAARGMDRHAGDADLSGCTHAYQGQVPGSMTMRPETPPRSRRWWTC
jgi:hypothetical protein